MKTKVNNKTLREKLMEVIPEHMARFLIWYKSDENKRKPFEELQDAKIVNLDVCIDWLTREDCQNALQVYEKHMRKYKLMELYNSMYDKAMTGDVNAAKYVNEFANGKFFDETDDKVEDFMKNVNLSSLKGKGGK